MHDDSLAYDRRVIGDAYRRSWAVRIAALAAGAFVVVYDLLHPYEAVEHRLALGALAIALLVLLARGDVKAIGTAMPQPSVRWWIKMTGITGAVFGVIVIGLVILLVAIDRPPPLATFESPQEFLWRACVVAPVLEEPIYRIALCAPLVAIVGRWPTIVASGGVFALLHVSYGNLSPDNALAGVLLGWAYLRSGSVWIPLALHAIGNAFVLIFVLYAASLFF